MQEWKSVNGNAKDKKRTEASLSECYTLWVLAVICSRSSHISLISPSSSVAKIRRTLPSSGIDFFGIGLEAIFMKTQNLNVYTAWPTKRKRRNKQPDRSSEWLARPAKGQKGRKMKQRSYRVSVSDFNWHEAILKWICMIANVCSAVLCISIVSNLCA